MLIPNTTIQAPTLDPYAKVSDQKTAGTSGGTFTAGAWRTRTINTEDVDADGILALSADQITLLEGTYRCRIRVPGFNCGIHQAKLINVTDNTSLVNSGAEFSTTGVASQSLFIAGTFTIAAGKALEVQHQGSGTGATNGLGVAGNYGLNEIYVEAEFWKIA